MNWIETKKELPKIGKWVLVWDASLKMWQKAKLVSGELFKMNTPYDNRLPISYFSKWADVEKPTAAKKTTKKK